MTKKLNPYLNFRGEAREAITFYQSVFGGELDITTYADMGGLEEMGVPETEADNIMHAMLVVSEGVNLMASDVASTMAGDFANGQIALSGDASEEPALRGWFEGLADGGQVHVPLEKAPWGDWFGQCADRYGVTWMVNIAGA